MFLSSCLVILASKERVTSVRGRIHVRAKTSRKGKHVRGEDTHAQSRSSAKQNDLLRGFLVLSSRPQWPAAATFPPRVFAPLSFSFSFLKFYSKSFLLLATLKSTPLLFFLSFFFCIENSIFNVIAHRFYSSKFNVQSVQIKFQQILCLDYLFGQIIVVGL